MRWFQRRKPLDDETRSQASPGSESPGLVSGLHRSPGMAALTDELARYPPRSILDLGTSSTENVSFLSRYCPAISIQDFFQTTRHARSGSRSAIFRFDETVVDSLPAADDKFDVVLLWDLLHYFDRRHVPRLIDELGARSRRGALIYLLASTLAPIPLTPIRFKIHDRETLDYLVASADRAAAPQLRTRDVESFLKDYEPEQLFQLRNGLQEFLFRFRGGGEG
jgi:hypothetical protein